MATTRTTEEVPTEVCPDCDAPTRHDVSIEILSESRSDDAHAKKFSREPYRRTECLECGRTRRRRMNDA